MSRFKHAARAFVSGYVVLGANLVYTMASVPLALHYLSKEEFGLWAVITQIASYFALLDFGMNGAVARILADHKDDRNGGNYGAVLKTGALVFASQGLLIAILGSGASWILPQIMGIPAHLQRLFSVLMAVQCLVLGFAFCTKILGSSLWCHQRSDVINVSNTLVFAVNFAVLWLGFHFGMGLYSMLLSNAAGVLCNTLTTWIASARLRLYPDRHCWGVVSSNVFWEVFHYARNLFFITIGTQLLTASQVIIVTRTLGLDAAAVWSIATKAFTLAQQVVHRICDYSIPALVEMFVRREITRLQKRFRQLVLLSASLSVLVGATVAVCNGSFLAVWTRGRISWGVHNDTLMAVFLVVYATVRCYTSLMDVTKNVRVLGYVSLLEGILFFVGATFLGSKTGFSGIIALAIVVDVALSGAYGLIQTVRYFKISVRLVLFDWLRPALQMAAAYVPACILIWWLTSGLSSLPRLIVCGCSTATTGALLLYLFGVTPEIRNELITRIRNALIQPSKSSIVSPT